MWPYACDKPFLQNVRYSFVINQDNPLVSDDSKQSAIKCDLPLFSEEISLQDALQFWDLSDWDKMALCLRISRAVLDLCATPWLQPDWGIRDIYLFNRTDTSSLALDIHHPYLRINPHPVCSAPSDGRNKLSANDHHFQPALSLGVVLIQILLGDHLQHLPGFSIPLYNGTQVNYSLLDDIKGNLHAQKIQATKLFELLQRRSLGGSRILKPTRLSMNEGRFGPTVSKQEMLSTFQRDVVFQIQYAILADNGCPTTAEGLHAFLEAPSEPRKVPIHERAGSLAPKRSFQDRCSFEGRPRPVSMPEGSTALPQFGRYTPTPRLSTLSTNTDLAQLT